MTLSREECELLISVFDASIENAMRSGIPIGKEHYSNIDNIKEKLYKELCRISLKEEGGSK